MAELTKVNVVVINASTVLKDRMPDVQAAVAALQTQVERDFAPVWGRNANVALACHTDNNYGALEIMHGPWWWLVLLDDTDEAGVLGYQELTNEGMPLGKVFVRTSEAAGRRWTVTASHELLEMLADPSLSLSVFKKDIGKDTGMFYAYDICDPCQEDTGKYAINGTAVSNFVYPAWFQSIEDPRDVRFDYNGEIKKPFDLLPGGFIHRFDPAAKDKEWQQKAKPSAGNQVFLNPLPGSRRAQRSARRRGNALGRSPVQPPTLVPPPG